jgi:hypothetical protein
MDCRTARLLVDFQRPRAGELPPDEAQALECHLASCPECDAAVRAEHRFDEHIGPAVRDVPVPEGLRERLLSRLREERLAPIRRKLAWTARGIAVAAAALIGVLVWWHFFPAKPPRPDLRPLAEAEQRKQGLTGPESVAAWYEENEHIAMVPPPFEYRYLVGCNVADLQGKRVPRLSFYCGDVNLNPRATVYVLSREQFDLDDLGQVNDGRLDDGSDHVIVWEPRAERPNTAYVIFLHGDDLDPLLPEGGGAR